jgi:hypothetical protein
MDVKVGYVASLRERRRWIFENKVTRAILGTIKEEITRDWRKMHNEELHNLYSSQNIIKRIKSRTRRRMGPEECTGK